MYKAAYTFRLFLMASLILLAVLFATNNLLSNVMAQENGYEDDSYNNNSADLYTSWEDFTPGNTDIFFKSSHALHDPINLSNTTGTSQFSQVSSSDDNVYVIWEDNISGNKEILFRASHDNGQTFGNIINLSNNTGTSFTPDIFSHGNNVYVVWTDTISRVSNDIFFTSSKDNGQTFSEPVNLSNNNGSSTIPQLSSYGTNVYVTWMDNSIGDAEIFFAFSIDNGQIFSSPINLSNNPGTSLIPQISSFGDNVYVVWSDNTPGNNDILMRGNGGGVTFGTTINISNNTGSSQFPNISSIGKDIYVVWQDFTAGAGEIFSITNNQIISSPINLSNNLGNSQSPQVSSS
jgi:hypothetical protein